MNTAFVTLLFVTMILYVFIFNTPHIIINVLCRSNGRTQLTYVFNHSDTNSTIKTVTYSFDHGV